MPHTLKKLVTYLCFSNLLKITNGQTLNDSKNLYMELFNGYTKQLFPIADPDSGKLNVTLKFLLKSIRAFDDVNELLSISAAISIIWSDPSLKWSPEQFGNMSILRIPRSNIWFPWLYLLNSDDEIGPIGKDSDFARSGA